MINWPYALPFCNHSRRVLLNMREASLDPSYRTYTQIPIICMWIGQKKAAHMSTLCYYECLVVYRATHNISDVPQYSRTSLQTLAKLPS